MLTPLLLLWPISLALTWLVAQSIAGKPFDRALEYNVQALAQLVTVQGQRASFNLPQPAREILRADDSDHVYYQVGSRGDLLTSSATSPRRGRTSPPGDTRCATPRCAASTCASPTVGQVNWACAALVRWRKREKRSVLATNHQS